MNYGELLKAISDYVIGYYIEHQDPRLFYHNITHTKETLEACQDIAAHYQLNDQDRFVVMAATWFHDTGYLTVNPPIHEEKSSEIAESFLKSINVEASLIEGVKGCIMATKMPQNPHNLIENIVCDADLFHLGTEKFKPNSKLLRKEAEALNQSPVDGKSWRSNNIKLLESHQYHTEYCRGLLEKQKLENLQSLKKKDEEKIKKGPAKYLEPSLDQDPSKNRISSNQDLSNSRLGLDKTEDPRWWKSARNLAGKKESVKKSEKSIETMFRIASANHQRLSSMADNKAHIMISVNSLILTGLVSFLIRKIEDSRYLVAPTIILLSVCVITMTFSVLATRPGVTRGIFNKEQVISKSINLLFFGNFHKMGYNDYDWAMKRMMNDKEFLYESLINDMYWHGVVLGKKYKLLRASYSIFMYGIAISIISYILSFALVR